MLPSRVSSLKIQVVLVFLTAPAGVLSSGGLLKIRPKAGLQRKAQLITHQAVPSILAAVDWQAYSGQNPLQSPFCRFAIFTSAWVNRAQSGRVLGPLHARQMAAGLEVIARSAHPDARFGHSFFAQIPQIPPHG